MPEGVDYQLHRKVEALQGLIVQVNGQISQVGAEVTTIGVAQQQTQSDLARLRDDFLEFTRASERRDNIQRAETRIGALQDQLEHEYGHHKIVRKTAIGLLQAFDTGLVSETSVQNVAEQLMIQTPRYWLAPALVALSAWTADDRDLCDRAVSEAYRRDPSKTALLFTLILRRQNRLDSSARWLQHYLNAQDPTKLGRDFAVILEAVAQGGFGPAGRAAADETMSAWRAALSDDAAHDAQVARWRSEIERYRAPSAAADFQALTAVSPQWPQLETALSGAEGNERLLEHYTALLAEATPAQDRIEDAMDDILDRLVNEYDQEELPLRRDLAYNQAVVARDGDMAAARTEADRTTAALETTLDYLSVQSESALNPAGIGVSRATQKAAIAACRPWFGQAYAEATRDYNAALPGDVEVRFASTHNVGSTAFQLPDWSGQLSAGLPALEQSLSAHWDGHGQKFVDSLAFPVARKVALPAIATVVVAVIGFIINPIAGVVLLLAVGGIWGAVLYNQYQQSLKLQQQAKELLATWKQESLTQLRGASAELTDFGSRFGAANAKSQDVQQFISSLETAGASATPFERRTIQTAGGMA